MQKLSLPKDSLQATVVALIFGIFLGEFYLILEPINARLSEQINDNRHFAFFGFQALLVFTPFVASFFIKSVRAHIGRMLVSWRFDLLLSLISGVFLVFAFDGFYINAYRNWISGLNWHQLGICVFIYFFVFVCAPLLQAGRNFCIKKKSPPSFFLGDSAITSSEDDGLNFTEDADRLAERIYNNGSLESLIFGIDAPWGTGKSSFLNLCKEYWGKNHKDKLIVYTFEPTRFENRENLLDKFIHGLIGEIKKHAFAPEIEPLLSRYVRLLKSSNLSFSLFGFSVSLPFSDEPLDDTFVSLERAILNFDKKIIIIIDDLDRLHFSEIKEILYKIKNAFNLKNVSYVLCYDTKNLTGLAQGNLPDQEHQSVIEFLEKYVTIKYNLYLDSKALLHYFSENKEKSLARYPFADPRLVSKAVGGLSDIFSSKEFHRYIPFIGDIRKLKRLINAILLLEVEKTDFKNSDFNQTDLIHLLLIYINYPDIFRKIYYTEIDKYGFFSAVTKYDQDEYPKEEEESFSGPLRYKNSINYNGYLKTLGEEQRFLLNKVFDVSEILGSHQSDVPQDIITSRACFNGAGWGNAQNLREYIQLITRMSRPLKTGQHRFYLNKRDEFFEGKKLENIFAEDEFSTQFADSIHEQFWRVLINTPSDKYSIEKSQEAIGYILNNLPKFSSLEDLGLRHTLVLFLIKLLDKIGWIDEEEGHSMNSEENIISIAHWIFGEKEHKGKGVLDILPKKNRGVMGMYDLLVFRLSCCRDRGGDIFNLSRALSIHGDPNAPTQGRMSEILKEQMRELSQAAFAFFKENYIDSGKNIFEEINKISLKSACGDWFEFYKSNFETADLNKRLLQLKSTLKPFMLYQLTNTTIDSGIGCGFFDPKGNKDKKGISKAMNEYLFNNCFDGEKNIKNYPHFLKFLLSHSSTGISSRSQTSRLKYQPNINESLRILDKDMLISFWKKHGKKIRNLGFEKKNTKVVTVNYEVSYKEGLPGIYAQLDNLEPPAKAAKPVASPS